MKSFCRPCLWVALAVFALAFSSRAAVLTVPGTHDSLPSAVAAANPGDYINVSASDALSATNVNGLTITFLAAGNVNITIADCVFSNSSIHILATNSAIVSATIINNTFRQLKQEGVYFRNDGSGYCWANISGNTIDGSVPSNTWPAIFVMSRSWGAMNLTLNNNSITNLVDADGIVVRAINGGGDITCEINGNTIGSAGTNATDRGIWVDFVPRPNVTPRGNFKILNNTVRNTGGSGIRVRILDDANRVHWCSVDVLATNNVCANNGQGGDEAAFSVDVGTTPGSRADCWLQMVGNSVDGKGYRLAHGAQNNGRLVVPPHPQYLTNAQPLSAKYHVEQYNLGIVTLAGTVTVGGCQYDYLSVLEDTQRVCNVLTNDWDFHGEQLTLRVVSVTQPTNGTVEIRSGSTNLLYRPFTNFWGVDSFNYTVVNTMGGADWTGTARVTVNVVEVNDPPSFTKGSDLVVLEDAGAQSVTGWASNISAGPFNESTQTVSFILSVSNNPASLFLVNPAVSSAGTLTYTPLMNAWGTSTVSIVARDSGGVANGGRDTSATQTFVIVILPVNDAPFFTRGPDQYVDEDCGAVSVSQWATSMSVGPANEAWQSYDFTASAEDSSLFASQPLVGENGNLTFTPASNSNGSTKVYVRLTDNGGTMDGGVDFLERFLMIYIAPVNDTPVASHLSSNAIAENLPDGTVVGVLSTEDLDDGDTFTYELVPGNDSASFAIQSNELRSAISFNYEVKSNYLVGIRTTDSGGSSISNMFTIHVEDVIDWPAAVGDGYSVQEDEMLEIDAPGVLGNDAQDDGLPIAASLISTTTNGLLTLNANGSFTYQPATNFAGMDSFTYECALIAPPNYTSHVVTVTIAVEPVNDAPVAIDDEVETDEDVSVVVDVIANDNDVDNDLLTISLVTHGTNGTVAIGVGATNAVYTPAANVSGLDQFTYVVDDGNGLSATGMVTVTIHSVNDVPSELILSSNVVCQTAGSNALVGVLSTIDADVTDTHAYSLVAGDGDTHNDSFGISDDELLVNDALSMPGGEYSVRIETDDGHGGTSEASFTITIVDDIAPVITSAASATGTYGVVFGYAITAAGDAVAFGASGLPGGLSVDAGTGEISGSPTNCGEFAATITAADAAGNTDTNILNLTILQAPQSISFAAIPDQHTTNTLGISATADSGLPVSFAVLSGPALLDVTNMTFTSSGAVVVVASQAGDANWLPACDVTNMFDVALTPQAPLVFNPASPQTYGTTNSLSASGGSGTGVVSYAVISGDGEIVDGAQLAVQSGTGTVVVVAMKTADDLYDTAAVTAQVACAKADQAIEFSPIGETFWTNRLGLAVSSSSTLPVTLAVLSGPAAFDAGTNLSFNGYGEVVITATQPGDSNFNPAPTITNAFHAIGPEFALHGTDGNPIASDSAVSTTNGTDYGQAVVGVDEISRSFEMFNDGGATLTFIGVATSGTGAASFRVENVPAVIGGHTNAELQVVYAPVAGAEQAAAITFVFDGTNSPFVLNVAGFGLGGGIALSTNRIVFEGTFGGVDPTEKSVWMTNVGVSGFTYSNDCSSSWLSVSPREGRLESGSATGLSHRISMAGVNAGTHSVTTTIHSADATNSPQSVTVELTVVKADQTIAFQAISSQITTNLVELSAAAGSGLPVSFSVRQGPAVISGGTNLSFSGAGSVTIVADQPGDMNWNAAPAVTNVFDVTKAIAGLTLTNLSQTYDGSPRAVSAVTAPSDLSVLVTYDGTSNAPIGVGTYTIVAVVDDVMYQGAATGVLNVAKATQAPLVFNPASPQVFLTTNVLSVSGGSGMGDVSFAIVEGPGEIVNSSQLRLTSGTGTVLVRATKAGDANFSAAMVTGSVTAAKASQQPILFTPASPQVYLTTNALSISGGSGIGAVSYSVISGPGEIVNEDALRMTSGDGIVLVRASKAADADFTEASATAVVTAAKADQTISFATPADQGITNRLGLSATASSGLAVSFHVVDGSAVIDDGTNLSFTATGVVSVVASQVGNSDWNAASTVVRSFLVYPLRPAIGSSFAGDAEVTTARLGATIEDTFGAPVVERGIVWSVSSGFTPESGKAVSEVGEFGSGTFTQEVTGLASGLTNYFRAYAVNDAGTNYTSEAWVLMRPEAPVAMAASDVGPEGFQANLHPAQGALGYRLDLSTNADFSSFVTGYGDLSIGPDVSHTITGLTVGVTYLYRLRAWNDAGASSNSAVIAVTTRPLLTLLCNPPGAGWMLPASGTMLADFNVPQPIEAAANAGYRFVEWRQIGGGNVADAGAAATTVTLLSNSIVTAYFSQLVDGAGGSLEDWRTNWFRGTLFADVEICNANAQRMRFARPFWYCVQSNSSYRLMRPDGVDSESGFLYMDVTAQIEAQLQGGILDVGQCVVVTNIEFYSATFKALTNVNWRLRATPLPAADQFDTDGDGVPDEVEQQYGSVLNPTDPLDAMEDHDGDGIPSAHEWIAGTNPTEPGSYFRIAEVRRTDDVSGVIEWPSVGGRLYRISSALSVFGPYVVLESDMPATPPMNIYTDAVNEAEGSLIYRIDVRLP